MIKFGEIIDKAFPIRCGKCGSRVNPVWGSGRAALKCSRTNCDWEMSANEYAKRLHALENPEETETEGT